MQNFRKMHVKEGRTRLILSRKDGESLCIGDAKVTVERKGSRTRVIVEADASTPIVRSELLAAG